MGPRINEFEFQAMEALSGLGYMRAHREESTVLDSVDWASIDQAYWAIRQVVTEATKK